jgi:hypothetical protein
MTEELKKLLELAKKVKMSEEELERQRRSFAWGNAHFENERITKEMIAVEDEKLKAQSLKKK